ncbi:MAG: hypothetical protein FJ110_08540 [Deltaproteobacteria bacterium]|nr:hypothetical protein [Deltaproteobacteria bacterium]
MSEMTVRLFEALNKYGRFPTLPLGIKLAKEGENISQKVKYPLKDIGTRLAACQGLTLSRTFGWTIAFRKEDHACPLAHIFLGQIKPDLFLQGTIAGSYQDLDECARTMEASFPRWPLSSVQEVWISPLNLCEFEPDLAMVYGNPGQILVLIHAANFRKGTGIKSLSHGRGGCATWIAGVIQSKECTYMIPGSGERVFAGAQDHEMSFAIPYSQFENMMSGLEFMRKKGAYRYPVPNLSLLSQPKIPKEYFSIDPDFKPDPTNK